MHFYSVRDFRNSAKQVWDTLDARHDVVITNNGKPRAVMLPVSEDDFEDVMTLLMQARALWALRSIQQDAVKSGVSGMGMDDIDAEIAAARAERRQ
ncbi:MAG: type II toxin-antitoxin system Phd/YefM family antitoxin [Oscillospiraceae bacterium]|nr:type II toxin-antitoxin system Phd/YefM family antitoxin [Oscillospiraceae bacterium]